ncbi:MAG TPA: penicillin-binding protein 2, partial [Betaproteobacteria bacterium]|nr:penicillin-binding protein 2 [Betaproteobacteria bacterium]
MSPVKAELKDYQREFYAFRKRLTVGAVFFVLLFLLLLSRFVYLQVLQRDHYRTLAENNRISIVPIVPSRGLILDRNGVVLAHNFSAYTLEITPSKVKSLRKTIDALSKIVEITPLDRKRFKKLR